MNEIPQRSTHEFEGVGPINVVRYHGSVVCSLVLPQSGRQAQVEVCPPREQFGRPLDAQVNWAGMGWQDWVDASTYATLLRFAALEVAPSLEAV